MSAVRSRRRRVVRAAAPAAGLLAAALLVWQGSYAAFSGTTSVPGNSFTAGSVSLQNDQNAGNAYAQVGTVPFTVGNLKPGSTGTHCVVVKSNGNLAGIGKFYVPTETTTNAMDQYLTVSVDADYGKADTNCTGFSTTPTTVIPATAMNTIATTYASYATGAGSWSVLGTPPEVATYRFTYTLSNAAPNTVQGGNVTATFQWEVDNS